jgi:hypothetical protein
MGRIMETCAIYLWHILVIVVVVQKLLRCKNFTFPAALVILRTGDGIPPGASAPNRPQGLMMPTDNPATGR